MERVEILVCIASYKFITRVPLRAPQLIVVCRYVICACACACVRAARVFSGVRLPDSNRLQPSSFGWRDRRGAVRAYAIPRVVNFLRMWSNVRVNYAIPELPEFCWRVWWPAVLDYRRSFPRSVSREWANERVSVRCQGDRWRPAVMARTTTGEQICRIHKYLLITFGDFITLLVSTFFLRAPPFPPRLANFLHFLLCAE
jgi:hypothetical protein